MDDVAEPARFLIEEMFWCPAPFTDLYGSVAHFKPCCFASESHGPVGARSPLEYYLGPELSRMRARMLRPGRDRGLMRGICRRCAAEERRPGGTSQRVARIRAMAEGTDHRLLRAAHAAGTGRQPLAIHGPEWITRVGLAVFGNRCGLRCLMCNPANSSAIAGDLGLGPCPPGIWATPQLRDAYRRDLERVAPGLARISVSGGEPLTAPGLADYLGLFRELGVAQNVELRITTSLALSPRRLAALSDDLGAFGTLSVDASVDVVGRRAGYLRYGSDFEQVEGNLRLLQRRLPAVALKLTPTLSALSVGYQGELARFAARLGLPPPSPGLLVTPFHLRAWVLPSAVKRAYRAALRNEPALDPARRDELDQLLRRHAPPGAFWLLMAYLKQWDRRHGTDAREHYPELAPYYDRARTSVLAQAWRLTSPRQRWALQRFFEL